MLDRKAVCAIDFEYRKTNNARFDLVSCAYSIDDKVESVWLFEDKEAQEKLKNTLKNMRCTHVMMAFNVDAEARAFVSLGLNPIKFNWVDIQAEWKHLTNNNDKLGYGRHFFDGVIKNTTRPKWGDDDGESHDRTPVSLLACTYKLLGNVTREDYEFKETMRKTILFSSTFTAKDKDQILSYGAKDVHELFDLYVKMEKEYQELLPTRRQRNKLLSQQLWRGETVARAALIAAIGYPVDREKVVNFAANVPHIIKDLHEDINSQFEDNPPFRWNKRENRYSVNTKVIKEAIANSEYKKRWPLTDKKAYSLALGSFEKFFHWRHDFPRGNLFAQYLRWLKTNQSLNGFRPKSVNAKNKQTFFDYYGSDDRAHPYLNAYGSQTGRYQPKAIGYLHLKAAWCRSLVAPKKGKCIVTIDYSSQEFLVAALMSQDSNMIKAYESGDVYLYFAKLAGAVPWNGTRAKYKKERNRFKSTTLGISYQMGPVSLAAKLTTDTGEPHDPQDAQDLITQFEEAYPDYSQWIEDNKQEYDEEEMLSLPDGWYMWKDNDNHRSVGNFPIQGMGSCILRKAIANCQDSGLKVILPLHDALYCEIDHGDWESIDIMYARMREAFAHYFRGNIKIKARELIRMDIEVWGPDLEEGKEYLTPSGLAFEGQKVYIDSRSVKEYERFSKYFYTNEANKAQ